MIRRSVPVEEVLQERVEELFIALLREPEIKEPLAILDLLPKKLTYHNKAHTIDVMRECILFGLADSLNAYQIKEIAIAAAWHDVGFMKQYKDNEQAAVDMFEDSECAQIIHVHTAVNVSKTILDTAMTMKNGVPLLLQKRKSYSHVLDADVSNFGREDFFEKKDRMAKELGIDMNDPKAAKEFNKFTYALLKNHKWKSKSAKAMRDAQKKLNIKKLGSMIKK